MLDVYNTRNQGNRQQATNSRVRFVRTNSRSFQTGPEADMIFLLLLITGRRRRRRQRSRAAGVVQATSRPRGSSDADTAVWVWLLASGLSSPRGTCLAACCRGSGTCTTRGEGECAAKEDSVMYVTAAKRSSAYFVLLLPFAALSRRLRPPRL